MNYLAYIKNLTKHQKIVLWGASSFLRNLLNNSPKKNPNILGIVDKNPELKGKIIGHYKIYSPDDLSELHPDGILSTIYKNHETRHYELQMYLQKNFPKITLYDNLFQEKEENKNINSYYCPFCNYSGIFYDAGEPIRKHAKCPRCYSLERHRFLFFAYQFLIPKTSKISHLLHIAPEKSIYYYFQQREDIKYECIDLNPAKYPYAENCKKMNVLDLKYPSNTFDYIINNHVLEHIEDEAKFFSELLRVLKPDGKMIFSVPYYKDLEKTYQDKTKTEESERELVYGQKDHVIKYGKDIFQRLSKYGKATNIDRNCLPQYLTKQMSLSYNSNLTDAVIVMQKTI